MDYSEGVLHNAIIFLQQCRHCPMINTYDRKINTRLVSIYRDVAMLASNYQC